MKKHADGKKGIVYAIDIDQCPGDSRLLQCPRTEKRGTGQQDACQDRQEMVEAFERSEIDCLVNVNLFDEGFDCPDVEFIQMARPTLSLAKYLQMVGRGLRINHENKDKVCMIIDNVGNYRKFGLPDKPRNWEACMLV